MVGLTLSKAVQGRGSWADLRWDSRAPSNKLATKKLFKQVSRELDPAVEDMEETKSGMVRILYDSFVNE